MSIYAQFDSGEQRQFASNKGWGDVVRWVGEQDAFPSLIHLCEHGYEVELDALEQELLGAGEQVEDDDVRGTLEGLHDALSVRGDADLLMVTDGLTSKDDEEPPTEQHSEEPAIAVQHEFSSTQFNLPGDLAFEVRMLGERISSDDLADDGRELNPHLTIKYGLHTNDPEEVRKVVQDCAPIAIQFGPASHFSAPEYDVVKTVVESEALHALNKHIAGNLEVTDTYPEYKPHVTIACVKTGLGEHYAKMLNSLQGRTAVFDRLIFSDKERRHISIPLTAAAQFDEGGRTTEDIATIGAKSAGSRIRGAASRIRALKKNELVPLTGLAQAIELELEGLRKGLSTDLSAAMLGGYFSGAADVWTGLPHWAVPPVETASAPPAPPNEPPPTLAGFFGPDEPAPEVRFPVVEDALEVLSEAPALARPDFRAAAVEIKQGAFVITGELTDKAVADVRDLLVENLAKGPDREAFIDAVIDRLGEVGPLSESHVDQIFRNNVGAALSDGQDRALKNPMVVDAFPYRLISATHDTRVRKNHKALETLGLNGTAVYRFDDPTFIKFRGPWDWSCRCTWSPLSVPQAAARGVSEAKEWLARAKAMAAELGGSEYQYFERSAPLNPEFVTPPPFNPPLEFQRPT